jgi:hypothetical protein
MHKYQTGDKVKTRFTGQKVCVVVSSVFISGCERLALDVPHDDGSLGCYRVSHVSHKNVVLVERCAGR